MNAFKGICRAVGFTVICLAGAAACLVVTDNANLKLTRKDGTVIYDNTERFNAKCK